MTKHKKPSTDPYVAELSDWTDESGRLTVAVSDLLDMLDAVYLAGMRPDDINWPIDLEDFGVEDPALVDLVARWTERVDAA